MYFLSKLHDNSILTGSVDSFCLVCDSYLRSEDEAFTHTEKPIHKKNIVAAAFHEKYEHDNIIKVKKGYYCSFCNVLLSTSAKVGLHISDIKHLENKGVQILRRSGDHIIAFNEVLISQNAWHGMLDSACVICNCEFDDEDVHRSENIHVLNLIQSKCEFGEKYIYRKVDDDCFFCLTCCAVYCTEDKTNHHEDCNHQSAYELGVELKNKIPAKAKSSPKVVAPKNFNINDSTDAGAAKPVKNNANVGETVLLENEPRSGDTSKDLDKKKATEVTKNSNAKTSPKKQPEAESNDFIDIASKKLNAGINPKFGGYIDVNIFIIDDELHAKRCIICDIPNIRENEVEDHLYNDVHHQMMLKKHREALFRQVDRGNPMAERSLPDNIGFQNGKLCLKKSANKDNIEKKVINPSYQQVKIELPPVTGVQSKIRRQNPVIDLSSDEEENENHSNIMKMVNKLQENKINVNFSTAKAYCDTCKVDIQFDCASLEQHIVMVEHKNKLPTKNIHGMRLRAFARDNSLDIKEGVAYCKVCHVVIVLIMRELADHVQSTTHKDNLLRNNESIPVETVKAADFMNTLFRVESNISSDIVVNNTILLRHLSFHCITEDEGDTSKCMLCDVEVTKGDELMQHINTITHKENMGTCDVASLIQGELVRKIGEFLYHCGYCNIAVGPWLTMHNHLYTREHVNFRDQAHWNLQRCTTVIRNARPVQVSSLQAVNFA